MEFDNTLEVPLPPAEAWPLLLDIHHPGAGETALQAVSR